MCYLGTWEAKEERLSLCKKKSYLCVVRELESICLWFEGNVLWLVQGGVVLGCHIWSFSAGVVLECLLIFASPVCSQGVWVHQHTGAHPLQWWCCPALPYHHPVPASTRRAAPRLWAWGGSSGTEPRARDHPEQPPCHSASFHPGSHQGQQ